MKTFSVKKKGNRFEMTRIGCNLGLNFDCEKEDSDRAVCFFDPINNQGELSNNIFPNFDLG